MKNELLVNFKSQDKSPTYYQYYTRLFYNYYCDIDVKIIDSLCEAGYLYYKSILLTDSLIDNKEYSNLPLISTCQEETIKILSSVYGVNSSFWKYWNKRKREYFEAVKIEKKLQINDVINLKIYEDLADKKSAFGKVAIDCLYVLSQKDLKKHQTLLESHKYFSIGFQLYDDVKDFKEDFENGQFNWAINTLSKKLNFSDYNNDISILNKLLFIENVGQDLLKKSIEYFQKSLEAINDFKTESEWKEVIVEMKKTIENYLDITNGYIEVIQKKIKLRKESIKVDYFFNFSKINHKTIKKGLVFIKRDFLRNFSDLKHIMYLSDTEDFNNKEKIHYSDTFQRAILNDCLFDVSKKYNLNSQNYFKFENNYLISKINNDDIGGWSYFPTVKEISADIDDLGQIIQLFIKTGNLALINNYCLKPINICLSNRVSISGGIETWIIPIRGQTELQKKQEKFNNTKWGKGPDVEVVANFIYSLELYNSVLYKKYIENSIEYILKEQDEKGFWKSRWYYGSYYGTYICLRLLKKYNKKYSNQIQNALSYISNSQKNDNGFSSNDNLESDALSTAYALLSLKLFLQKTTTSIIKAEEYLIKTQNINGFWKESNFIKPKTHEPYKSKTLTTAIVLKSLCYE